MIYYFSLIMIYYVVLYKYIEYQRVAIRLHWNSHISLRRKIFFILIIIKTRNILMLYTHKLGVLFHALISY